MRSLIVTAMAIAILGATPAFAQGAPVNPQIDYSGFMQLTLEVAPYRETRRVSLDDFMGN